MKKTFILAICFIMLFPVIVNAAFTDVPSGHWAESYINKLTEKGVINGMGDGTFNPDGTLTKGQFIKLIMEASVPNSDFSILETDYDHWAAPYVKAAEMYGLLESGEYLLEDIESKTTDSIELPDEYNSEPIYDEGVELSDEEVKDAVLTDGSDDDEIVSGESTKFTELPEINEANIDDPITRIEVVKILVKADINIKRTAQNNDGFITFTDVGDLTYGERILLTHAVNRGFINGYPDGSFNPKGILTRAEASKIIAVFLGI